MASSVASASSRFFFSSSVSAVVALFSQCAMVFLAYSVSSINSEIMRDFFSSSRACCSILRSFASLAAATADTSSSVSLDRRRFSSAASARATAACSACAATFAASSALRSTSIFTRSAVVTHVSAACNV